MSEELPEGWAWASTASLAAPMANAMSIGPFGSNLKVSDYATTGVPLIFVRDIRAERFGGNGTKYVSAAKANELSSHTVRGGDLLVTKMGEPPGDTSIYPLTRPPGVITSDCIKLTPNNDLTSSGYLRLCIRGQVVRDQLVEQTMGVAQQKLSLARFRAVRVPLPPLREQRRIVAQAETLLEQVSRAKGRLDRVPLILKRFRQAVLAAACSGELTREWREERRLDWFTTSLGQQPIQVRIGPFGSLLHRSDYVEGGVPLVNPMHIRDGAIHPDRNFAVSPEKLRELAAYVLQAGDVVLGRRGEMGRAAVVGREHAGLLCGTGTMFLRPERDMFSSAFLAFCLRSPQSVNSLEGSSVGTTMNNLNQTVLAQLELPRPTLEEQLEVVRQIESLLAVADSIERRVHTASARADKLPKAILSKAFSGDLVPTEADLARAEGRTYETAEELLKRVTVAGATETGKKGTKARKRRSA